jgi:hypothetical protein
MNQRFSRLILAFRTSCVALVWLTISSSGHAQEVGRVISSTPVVQQAGFDTRVVAYNVVYEYAGRQYSVQLPQDPGPSIAVSVTPAVQAPVQPQVYAAAPTVVLAAPYVVRPFYPPVFPPVVFSLGWGYGGHHGHGGYGHRGHYGH